MADALLALLDALLQRPRARQAPRPTGLRAAACAGRAADAAAYTAQVCSYGEEALGARLVWAHGFSRMGGSSDGRVGGVGALAAGAACALSLKSRGLAAGFVTVGYERGWRNLALGTLECVAPCVCAPVAINATNPKPFTGTAFTPAVWVALTRTHDGSFECVLRVGVAALAGGRLLIQAATLSAPLPGNRSIAVKDGLEMIHADGYRERPFR
jgi:hypothetical protein